MHSSVVGHLSWFYNLVIVNTAVEKSVCKCLCEENIDSSSVLCPSFLPTVVTNLKLG